MASEKFEYRADLAKTTLPEMLFAVDRFRVPGMIEVSHAETVKRIFIRDGYVIHATSTDLRDSLGEYLRRAGRINRKIHEALGKEVRRSERRFGVLLIERGYLSPGEVHLAIREQIELIVWSLFFWQRGEVVFNVGQYKQEDMIHIQLPMGGVILEGIRRAPDPKYLVSKMGRKETVLEPCYKVGDLVEIDLTREEYELLTRVDGTRTLYQLLSGGPMQASDNAKLLYAFQVLQLVQEQKADGT